MSKVFLVSSGRFEETTGYTEWINLGCFNNEADADAYIEKIKADIGDFNEDKDFLHVEELFLK
jgi:hypothetical protein